MNDDYSPQKDRDAHFKFCTALGRERLVRTSQVVPLNDNERRQAEEGDKPLLEYDCVRPS